ncbi:MAG: Arm DNA-binding domain-containing protein, partial [Alphaproteobacteria bacterium]
MALTEIAIKSAKLKDKPYKISDTLGLYLLVQPNGSRLWRLKYRYS